MGCPWGPRSFPREVTAWEVGAPDWDLAAAERKPELEGAVAESGEKGPPKLNNQGLLKRFCPTGALYQRGAPGRRPLTPYSPKLGEVLGSVKVGRPNT